MQWFFVFVFIMPNPRKRPSSDSFTSDSEDDYITWKIAKLQKRRAAKKRHKGRHFASLSSHPFQRRDEPLDLVETILSGEDEDNVPLSGLARGAESPSAPATASPIVQLYSKKTHTPIRERSLTIIFG
ncbi:hypothetical protein ABEB36_014128 [Hypothenemus hampei]|uniref:Uncharacterized protein n=1 Tax=Hypothenemus hampei TaxID=57062 RepID=A0ABD1E3P0_HYPHA